MNSTSEKLHPDICLVKEVWKLMLGVELISQRDLIDRISARTGLGKTACFYCIKLMEKPIQIDLRVEPGQEQPTAKFIQEPLIIRVPTLERQSFYTLVSYWRDFVKTESEVFDKTKRFY
jgi:hypothetical protein